MSSVKPRAAGNMHFSVAFQVHVVNNQLVSPLSLNNRLSGTPSRKSHILMIYKHLDAKEKKSFHDHGVYNFLSKITYL